MELARIGLSIGDEFGNSFCRDCRIDHHNEGAKAYAGDRHNVTDEIESEVVVNRRIERVRGSNQEQRIAVRRCGRDDFSADIAACARPVIDDDRSAEPLRKRCTYKARDNVGRETGRISRRPNAPAVSDSLLPVRCAKRSVAWLRLRRDARIVCEVVSWRCPDELECPPQIAEGLPNQSFLSAKWTRQ